MIKWDKHKAKEPGTVFKGKHIRLTALDCIKAVFSMRVLQKTSGVVGKIQRIISCPEKGESLCFLAEAYGRRLILGSLADDVDYPPDTDIVFFHIRARRSCAG